MSADDYMRHRFPDLKPITARPSLSGVNGFGFTMYGKRAYDAETGSYIATHCFCLLFIPLFATGAYRVAPAYRGWYFLGRVPMSMMVKVWNLFLPLLLLTGTAGGWWHHYSTHPDTVASNLVAEGDRLAEQKKIGGAAEKYQKVATNTAIDTITSAGALDKLCQLFDAPLDDVESAELLKALKIGIDSFKIKQRPKNLVDVGLKQAQERSATDLPTAAKILELVTPLAPNDKRLMAVKKPILEKLHSQDPDNLDILSDLVIVYESEKRFDDCEKLLMPKRALLGSREGARVLGQILVSKEKFDEAMPLLEVYSEAHLKKLREAHDKSKARRDQMRSAIEEALKANRPPPGLDWARFQQLQNDRNGQNNMLNDFWTNQQRNDPELKRLQAELQSEGKVVQLVIDLGIALIRRGQTMANEEGRKNELEKAEKTFMRVRGVGGLTADLHIGQVSYWLGKNKDGRKLFEDLLTKEHRSSRILFDVAQSLREVGEVTEARRLAEEAFHQEQEVRMRDGIAELRAVMYIDIDDRIAWLHKIQGQHTFLKAEIACAMGDKAVMENRDAEAAKYLRESIGHYLSMPESAATLNNSALGHFSLYRILGDEQNLLQATANLEKALELMPRDSIILSNVADNRLALTVRSAIGKDLDWKTLKLKGNVDNLSYLYRDQATWDQLRTRLKKQEDIGKAVTLYERLRVLAPKQALAYNSLSALYNFTHDEAALKRIANRIKESELDHTQTLRRLKERHEGRNLDKHAQDIQNAISFHEKRLKEARKVGGATLALAIGELLRDKGNLQLYERQVDADDMVSLAEEAHQAAPSRGTQRLLVDALLARAHQELIKQEESYAAQAMRTKYSMRGTFLIPVLLGQDGSEAQKVCLEHEDVQQAIKLTREMCETFDDEFGPWSWALVRKSDSKWADAKSKFWLKNDLAQINRTINARLSPLHAESAYRQSWAFQMQGKAADADAVLKQAADQGVPLPSAK